MKSGTAEKMILNMISTATMVGLGKAYQNLMVDVMQTNEKLRNRAENIVMEATGVERSVARATIDTAKGSCKSGYHDDFGKLFLRRRIDSFRKSLWSCS